MYTCILFTNSVLSSIMCCDRAVALVLAAQI